MFQAQSTDQGELQHILEQELDYFNSVLQFSQKFEKQVKSLPVAMLEDMVRYRQEWIDKIQKLEEQRNRLKDPAETETDKDLIRKISQCAQKLVKIDERIYGGLQKRKLQYVKEHAQVVSETAYTKKQSSAGQSAKIVDIIGK